jgi:hypothetical protein
MPTPTITKTWSPLGANYCFSSYNQLGSDILAHSVLSLSGDFTLITTAATPGDTQYPWINPADGRLYIYMSGDWYTEYPFPYAMSSNTGPIIMWNGIESDIKDLGAGLDGVNAATTTAYQGPFWVKDTAFDARSPIGPGTLPESSTLISAGTTGGVDQVDLVDMLSSHTHGYETPMQPVGASPSNYQFTLNTDAPQRAVNYAVPRSTDAAGTAVTTHDNMHPYVGVWFIRRTIRRFIKYA